MIEVTLTGDRVSDITDQMAEFLPGSLTPASVIETMDLQALLLAVDQRLQIEGYDMEVWKKGTKPLPVSEKKREDAKATLRGQLEDSLILEKAKKGVDDLQAKIDEDMKRVGDIKSETPVEPKKTRTKKGGNGHEDPAALKRRCVTKLQELYAGGHKSEVLKILAEHGGGAKNFGQVPEENFGAISAAMEAIE